MGRNILPAIPILLTRGNPSACSPETMNEIINIEHNNERVLITEQLAQAYGCETKRISENFKRNEERFEEGKHYFKLDGDALRDFKITNPQIADNLKFAPVIMLWTRRGASRHSKMLGTDKAWE